MKKVISEKEQIEIGIKMLQAIFIQKLLNDEFQVTEADQYTVVLFVLEKYQFQFWISNEPENFKCYNTCDYINFMLLHFTEEQKQILYPKLRSYFIDKSKDPEEIAKRRKEFEKLKLEFENTGL